MFGLDPTATPNDVFAWLGEWGQANWKLLAEYNTAGAYTFTVPDDVDELGVFILGGGASGQAKATSGTVRGGNSGGLKQIVLKKSNNDFEVGEEIPVVVGAGGKGGTVNTGNGFGESNPGGTSAFKSIVSEGGQIADIMTYAQAPAISPYGLETFADGFATSGAVVEYTPIRDNPFGYNGRNIFDPSDTHVYCGAGGGVYVTVDSAGIPASEYMQLAINRTKGKAGSGTHQIGNNAKGENATAPGDGGGGVISKYTIGQAINIKGGDGADGLVMVYGRKVV
jgi:hypothetical protein